MKIRVFKVPSGALMPSLEEDAEVIGKWPCFEPYTIEAKRERKGTFHRKAMALFRLAFDQWEPGDEGFKNFDRFRHDCMRDMGHFELVFNIEGEVVKEAKSISFSNMDADEFNKVYSDMVTYFLSTFLVNYETRDEIDRVIENVLRFA